jgi:hypothetical protein
MINLRQATSSQEVPLGYFVDSTDGDTEETGLTIANTDVRLWKAGATALVNKNSGGATHMANGIYYTVLDATDTDTSGPLVVFVHVSGALPVRLACHVYPANVYDAMIGGDLLQVDAREFGGVTVTGRDLGASVLLSAGTGTGQVSLASGALTIGTNNDKSGYGLADGAITATKLATDAITADKIAANAIGASEIAADAVAEIQSGLSTLDASGVRSSIGMASANLDAQLSAIPADLDNPDQYKANVSGLSTLDAGAVQTAVTTSLDAYDPPTHAELTSGLAGLNDVSPSEVSGAVWDEPLAGHMSAGSTGEALGAAGGTGDPWVTPLPGAYGSGTAGHILGNSGGGIPIAAGSVEVTYVVTDANSGLPVEGAEVWIATDNNYVNIVWRGTTRADGEAFDITGNRPFLDPGAYYVRSQKSGYGIGQEALVVTA